MKLFFLGLSTFLITGSVVLACPDLSGNYKRDEGGGRISTQKITQRVEGGKTLFIWGDGADTMILDGVTRSSARDGQAGSYIARCEGDKIVIDMSMTAPARMDVRLELVKTPDGGYAYTSNNPQFPGVRYQRDHGPRSSRSQEDQLLSEENQRERAASAG